MMRAKLFIISIFICATLGSFAQVKPNTQTQPSATTQTLNPVPSAYSAGIPINYIRTWDASRPYSADTSLSSPYRVTQEVKQVSQFMDGLSRPIQTVAKQVTPNGYDMVSAQVYDQYSREIFKYLPFADTSADGNFNIDPFIKQSNFEKAFYNPTNDANGEKFFYGKIDVEASPAGRVVKTYAAGNSWAGRGVGVATQYLLNTAADSVCIWNIGYTGGAVPTYNGFYPASKLIETQTTDERGYNTVEYKNNEGHVILKKVQVASGSGAYSGPTGWLNTYYVYDEVGNLRFVIQPKAVEYMRTHTWGFDGTSWSTSTLAKELCFSYEFDSRGRLTVKRIPGSGEVWLVYDQRDRLVMTQDSLQRGLGKWLYTDYDSLNRPLITGIWTTTGDRTYHQNLAGSSITYPTPSSNYTVLTQMYYDNYSWVSGSGSGVANFAYTGYNSNTNYFYTASDVTYPYPRTIAATNLTRGMVTGTKVNVVNTGAYLYSVSFYDDRMRVVQTQSNNYTGDIDTTITQYSFSGQVLRTLFCHGKGGTNAQVYKVLAKSTYDAAGRLIQLTQRTGVSAEVIIDANSYDELGQLAKKKLGQTRTSVANYSYTTTPVDSLSYEYNIRGWLRGINKNYANAVNNNNWFGMELNYDFGFNGTLLNGNILGIKWRNAGDGAQRAYGFTYDGANRLTKADFTQNAGGGTWDVSAGIDFSVHGIGYDQNGNITTMRQMGLKINTSVLVDSLVYSYNTNSNRLNYVTDRMNDTTAHLGDFTEINNNTTQDYWYDGNGNLTKDLNKNIANIHYNFLNLPDSITVTGKGTINYVYTATGVKLQKIVNDTTTSPDKITRTDYAGIFVYQNDTLQYVATPEGRARPKNINMTDTMFYDYFEKDHLGNTRVVLTDEKQQDIYPAATLENNTSAIGVENSFYTINMADTISTSRIASWASTTGKNYVNNNGNPPYNNNPYTNTTATSAIVYKLNGSTGDKTGLGVTLKVMTGDAVDIYAKSFWHNSGTLNNSYPVSSALTNFVTAFAGTGGVVNAGKGSATTIATAINGNTADVGALKNVLDTAKGSTGSTPRAYINWILFDEQFKPVSSGSGFDLVSTTGDNVKSHHNTVNIAQGGYLYVYCSNESNYDVFFDNLQVIDTRGPLLETDNYYPFGLAQSGISSQAAGKLENKYKYNGKELQHKEFSDGSGLELYDYGARTYDVQIGRWDAIDPHSENYLNNSGYNYVGNNPVSISDLDGRDWKVTTYKTEDGQTIYNIQLTGVVYNNSSKNDIDMAALENAIKKQITDVFNTSGDGFAVNIDVDLKVVNTVDDIKETDHVFEVVNQKELGADNQLGRADPGGGTIVKIGVAHIDEIIKGDNSRTIAHELGHTAGWEESMTDGSAVLPSSYKQPTAKDKKENLMSQTAYVQTMNNTSATNIATKILNAQMQYFYDNYQNDKINKSPKEWHTEVIFEPVEGQVPKRVYKSTRVLKNF